MLGLTNYSSIHLRLEDDLLKHVSKNNDPVKISNQLLKDYNKNMNEMFSPTDPIYLATHLCKAPHKLNAIPYELQAKFNGIKFITSEEHWTHTIPYNIEGREIDAIVDLLICYDSDKFIGSKGSTFSQIISNKLKNEDKCTILV